MAIKISGVRWTETVEVSSRGKTIVLQVMTMAGRLYRSTSLRLTRNEAVALATELANACGRRLTAQTTRAADGAPSRR